MEEAMVLAIERYLLPGYVSDQQTAYEHALTRVCTSITKGFFRKFAVDHYPEVETCPKDIVSIANGILKQYREKQQEERKKEQDNTKKPFPKNAVVYFTKEESVLANVIIEHIDEWKDPTSFSDTAFVPFSSIRRWHGLKEKTFLRNLDSYVRQSERFSSYGDNETNYYNHDTHGYSTTPLCRYFRIRPCQGPYQSRTVSVPCLFVRIETHHEHIIQDCSESLNWSARFVLTRADCSKPEEKDTSATPKEMTSATPKEMKERLHESSTWLTHDNKPAHMLDFDIRCSISEGGSDSSSSECAASFNSDQEDFTFLSLLMRCVLSLTRPHMASGGEKILRSYLGARDSSTTKSIANDHHWHRMFTREVQRAQQEK